MLDLLATSGLSATLLLVAGWLGRTWISKRLTASLRLEIESQLEDLKSKLARANESIRTITGAGTAAKSQAQAALLPAKINAIQTVWASVIEWRRVDTQTLLTAALDLEWVTKHGSDPGTKSTFEIMLKDVDTSSFVQDRRNAELARPFLTENGWALYYAYHSFYLSRLSRALMLTHSGLDHASIWKVDDERSLVKASATPEVLAKYDENSALGGIAFVQYLGEEMIKEFRADLSGNGSSDDAVINASEIVSKAEALVRVSEREPSPDLPDLPD